MLIPVQTVSKISKIPKKSPNPIKKMCLTLCGAEVFLAGTVRHSRATAS